MLKYKIVTVVLCCSFVLLKCSQPKTKKKKLQKEIIENIFDTQIIISGKNNLKFEVNIQATLEKKNSKDTVWLASINYNSNKIKKSKSFNLIKSNQLEIVNHLVNEIYKIPFDRSKSANFKYVNGEFEDVKPIVGSEIDTIKLKPLLVNLKNNETYRVDLFASELYVQPKYQHSDERTKKAKLDLEKCIKTNIKLKSPRGDFELDHEQYGNWLSLDDSMKVKVDILAVQKYVENLARKVEIPISEVLANYPVGDTNYKGEEPKLERLKLNNEINEISKMVISGKSLERELVFTNINLPHGIKAGLKNFVEVSIEFQKFWLFKEGSLLLETDIVTGNESLGRSTPKGTYAIKAKAKNVVLKGQDYASPVSYWMPFHKGYGLHDANWRRRFGSTIYLKNGSHGCVNMPTKFAPLVFANVNVGTPVIIR